MPTFAAGIAFRAASSSTNQATTTLVLPTPAGVVSGDVLLAGISVRGKPTITAPSGWSLAVSNENGTAIKQAVYVHVATASEPGNVTWTFSKAGSAAGGIVAYMGVDAATPVDAAAGQSNGTSATITAPSVTTTVADDMLVGFFGTSRTSDIAPAASLSERYDMTVSTALKYKISTEAADESRPSAGPTGTRTATANGASQNVGQLVALKPAGPQDSTPPTVNATSPDDAATNVDIATNVTATFSENVTGVSGTSFTLTGPGGAVAAAVSYSAGSRTGTLNPSGDLAYDTTYTAALTGAIKDSAGNQLSSTSWSFHTAAQPQDTTPPTVTGRSPASGATNVSVATNVTATFSESVTGVSGTSFTLYAPDQSTVAAVVNYDAGTLTATLNPSGDLSFDTTYAVLLTSAITDTNGNPLAETAWSFHTAAAQDTTPPTVTTTSPLDSATGVAVSANVTATFSENVTGVSGTSFTLTGPGGAVAAAVTYSAGTFTGTLNPSADLAADTTYTASLSGVITDTAGNTLSPVSWSFHTATAAPPTTIAFLSASSGANDATTTLVLPKPNGVAAGQVLLGLVSVRGAPVITPPAGWTLAVDNQNSTTMRQSVYVHTAGASEPASFTWTFSKAGSASGGISAYSGVDPLSQIDSSAGQVSASSVSIVAPSITTKTSDTMLVGYFGIARTTTLVESTPLAERFEATAPSTVTYKITSAAADEPRPLAGPTGTRTATGNGASGNIGQLIALRRQGAPPGADFDATPLSGVVPLAVSFHDLTNGSPSSWAWDFDSNGTIDSTLQNPTYTYPATGLKTVTLTVTGGTGSDSEVKTNYILVDPVPPSSGSDPTLVGAGDIASCASTGDEDTAALLDTIPGTVFTAGDNVYESGTTAEWTNCYDPTWGRHKARTRPALGNHDHATGSATEYYTYFGANAGDPSKGYYSYDLGSWHVVVLNTECSMVGGCGAGSPQEAWLKQDLAANTSACTVAYWHNPLFTSSSTGGPPDVKAFWDDLIADGTELVMNGDKHVYERFAPQDSSGRGLQTGMREFIVGTGGRSHGSFVATAANSQVRDNTSYGVLKLTLHATGYSWQFVPVAGASFTDSGAAACH